MQKASSCTQPFKSILFLAIVCATQSAFQGQIPCFQMFVHAIRGFRIISLATTSSSRLPTDLHITRVYSNVKAMPRVLVLFSITNGTPDVYVCVCVQTSLPMHSRMQKKSLCVRVCVCFQSSIHVHSSLLKMCVCVCVCVWACLRAS